MNNIIKILILLSVSAQFPFSQEDIEKMNKLEYISGISSKDQDEYGTVLFIKENNPVFNSAENIEFAILKQEYIKLSICDNTGNEIQMLINEELNAGSYKTGFDPSALPPGEYFYRLTAGELTQTKKMILIK